jgi:hypothetical protein
MIRIVQIGKEDSNPLGVRQYEVGINNFPAIATFKHRRSDGLAVCLAKASAAVEKAKWEEAGRMLEALQK